MYPKLRYPSPNRWNKSAVLTNELNLTISGLQTLWLRKQLDSLTELTCTISSSWTGLRTTATTVSLTAVSNVRLETLYTATSMSFSVSPVTVQCLRAGYLFWRKGWTWNNLHAEVACASKLTPALLIDEVVTVDSRNLTWAFPECLLRHLPYRCNTGVPPAQKPLASSGAYRSRQRGGRGRWLTADVSSKQGSAAGASVVERWRAGRGGTGWQCSEPTFDHLRHSWGVECVWARRRVRYFEVGKFKSPYPVVADCLLGL